MWNFIFVSKGGQVWLCQSCFPGRLRVDLLYTFRMITRTQKHCCCVGSNGDHAAEGGQPLCCCWPACQGTCAALLLWRPWPAEITLLSLDTPLVVSLMQWAWEHSNNLFWKIQAKHYWSQIRWKKATSVVWGWGWNKTIVLRTPQMQPLGQTYLCPTG